MQPIKLMKFWRQFTVLVQRNLRLILNDKLTMASLILQAPFMVLVIKMVVDPDCFTSNLINIGSRTALFIISAMAAFMGTLNSYREICKEREIILREASVGVSLLAVVLRVLIDLEDDTVDAGLVQVDLSQESILVVVITGELRLWG